MVEPDDIQVLCIAGHGRSGSTVLEGMLGGVGGFFAAGELRHIFREGFAENRLCSCGEPFRACPFWREVAALAYGGIEAFDHARALELKRRVDAWWRIPRIATGRWPTGDRRAVAAYADLLRRLYPAIRAVSGARVVVDSSKDVSHAWMLTALGPPVAPHVLHLVRDSRAVAYSWQRAKFNPGSGRDMDRYGIVRTALEWDAINLLAAALRWRAPYRLLRYDELVADPRAAIAEACALVGAEPGDTLGADGRTVVLEGHHTVAGNPVRFARGELSIRADEEWRGAMPSAKQAAVWALTAPVLAATAGR